MQVGSIRWVVQRQKPSMHTSGLLQLRPWAASHSVPRFDSEPHTEYVPVEVVTFLQTLKRSLARQASDASASHAM